MCDIVILMSSEKYSRVEMREYAKRLFKFVKGEGEGSEWSMRYYSPTEEFTLGKFWVYTGSLGGTRLFFHMLRNERLHLEIERVIADPHYDGYLYIDMHTDDGIDLFSGYIIPQYFVIMLVSEIKP